MRPAFVRVLAVFAAVATLGAAVAGDGVLGNVSKSLRVTPTSRGTQRVMTLRATFNTVAAHAFDLRRDPIAVAVDGVPEFQVPPRTKGRRRSGGRVLFSGRKVSSAPFLKKLVVWPARGQVKIDVGNVPAQGSILTQDPLPVVLRLGDATFAGAFSTSPPAEQPGTPLLFQLTDTWPETFVCSTQTMVISDPTSWDRIWSLHAPTGERPLPVVDFSKEIVVGAFLGPRENRGFSASVTKVEERADDVLVTFTERRPSDGCHPTPVAICLYVFATLPRTGKPVRFDHRVVSVVCDDQ